MEPKLKIKVIDDVKYLNWQPNNVYPNNLVHSYIPIYEMRLNKEIETDCEIEVTLIGEIMDDPIYAHPFHGAVNTKYKVPPKDCTSHHHIVEMVHILFLEVFYKMNRNKAINHLQIKPQNVAML
jgi:hypothetical protein